MSAVVHPLYPIRGQLEEAVGAGSEAADKLAALLQGAGLPATGGREEPADQLYRALSLPPVDPELPAHLAKTAAVLVARRAQTFAEDIAARKAQRDGEALLLIWDDLFPDEAYVYNLLLFASFLPAEESLFQALQRFAALGLVPGALTGVGQRTPKTLLQALIYQQTDASLESFWLDRLQLPAYDAAILGDDEISAYLDAWTGLLWIPPTAEARARGETANPERARRGLEALAARVEESSEGITILHYAVARLDEAFPRDPTYWAEAFQESYDSWPEVLLTVAAERWPPLVEEDSGLPEEMEEILQALAERDQEQILGLEEAGDAGAWKTFWTDVIFKAPPAGQQRAAWISNLNLLRAALEARSPQLASAGQKNRDVEALAETVAEAAPTRRRARGKAKSTFDAYQSTRKAMAAIEEQLKKRNLPKAQRYLRDLIAQQEKAGTEAVHIVKSLSKSAALALRFGYESWAEDLYRQAIKLPVQDAFAHTGLAEVLKALGRLDEARELYQQTIQRWPDNVVAHNGLAEVLKTLGRLDEARELYGQTIQRWPDNVVAHTGLAEVLKALGRHDEARELYQQTIQRWPDNVVAHNGLAEVLKALGRLDEARELYQQTIQRWPADVFAHNGLAEVLKTLGRLDEARELYQQTIQRWPDNVVAHSGLAEVLKALGRLDEALQIYQQTIQRWPDNVVAHNGLAEVLKALGRLDEALQIYQQTIQRWPADVVAHNGLAEVLKALGRLDEARELYEQTIQRWPNALVAQNGLANVLRAQGRFEEALAILRLPEGPTSERNRYDLHLRGMILLEAGDAADAEALFHRCLDTPMPEAAQRLFHAGLVLARFRQAKWKEAEEELAQLPKAALEVAILYLHAAAAQRDTEKAIRLRGELEPEALPGPAARTLTCLDDAYGLASSGATTTPAQEKVQALIAAEIEMLLAAAISGWSMRRLSRQQRPGP